MFGFYKTLRVKLNERVVLFKNGLPVRALSPGRHRLWGRGFTEQRFKVDDLIFDVYSEVAAVLPSDWYSEIQIADHERAVLFAGGRPVKFLYSGMARFWTLDPSVRVEVFDTTTAFPSLSAELEAVVPTGQYTQATIQSHERGMLKVCGKLESVLEPGLYRFWNTVNRPVVIDKIDVRRTELSITGQELMTRDKVTLRLSISVEYAVVDVALSRRVTSVRDAVYVAAQLAARDYVAGVTLDALLEGRDALTRAMSAQVLPVAQAIGVSVEQIGVKDVVLPGEMKVLLNRVIEAEKEAQANVILRREETAATRSLANTAKVMAQEPVLLRLKELEAMKEIAENISEVRVVIGAEGFASLVPSQFLGGAVTQK